MQAHGVYIREGSAGRPFGIRRSGSRRILIVVVCAAALFPRGRAYSRGIEPELPWFTVDASRSLGAFRPLHGVNGGPWVRGGTYDMSERFQTIAPPLIRLHDCGIASEGAVDIHSIFPDFGADPDDPESYRFERTDAYLAPIVSLGAEIMFRLGESIEKGARKYHVHPPPDFEKWARVCCQIVRHYNEGWADGYEWDIRYWEIWNEPDNPNCWTGTMEEYCRLYETAAVALKSLDPSLRVGGPALIRPLDSKPGRVFLEFCRDTDVPLDFVSWHGYEAHPDDLMKRVEAGRAVLDAFGMDDVETYFTEWNMVTRWVTKWPGGSDTEEAREVFEITAGERGAAFAASFLAYLQDSPLDGACYYSAYGGSFRLGFFDQYMAPKKPYFSFLAFHRLIECGTRVAVSGNRRETGVGIAAACDASKQKAAILLSNFANEASRFGLRVKNVSSSGALECAEYVVDESRSLEWDRDQILGSGDFRIVVELPAATVRLLLIHPWNPETEDPRTGRP